MYTLEHNVSKDVIVVATPDGYDLSEWTVIDTATEDPAPLGRVWDKATRTWIARTRPATELARDALNADAFWSALDDAMPAQIDAWLVANVTDLASARRVLKMLLLAVRFLKLNQPM